MTAAANVTVWMLQGMVGERLTLEPGDLYDVPAAPAKLWAEHGVAALVKAAPKNSPAGGKVAHRPG